jgi:hypothetical protein
MSTAAGKCTRQPAENEKNCGGSARDIGVGRGCGDGASAGDVILGTTFEAPTTAAGFNDRAVVREARQQCARHSGVGERVRLFAEARFVVSPRSSATFKTSGAPHSLADGVDRSGNNQDDAFNDALIAGAQTEDVEAVDQAEEHNNAHRRL